MNHVYPKLLINIQKVAINPLQRLVILLQRLKQHRLGLEKRPRHHHIRHLLQHASPRSYIRARMRRSEKDDPIRRHKDRAEILLVPSQDIIRVQQRPLGQDPAEAVGDPYYGDSLGALALAELGERCDEGLGMLVDEVVAGAAVAAGGVDVGVVAVYEDVGVFVLERGWEQVCGPEDAVCWCCPGPLGVAV